MGRKVIILFHGVGRQARFSTVNAFLSVYLERHGGNATHCLKDVCGKPVSCISITGNSQELDIYEYHWSHLSNNIVRSDEVIDWVFKVAEGAKQFYSKNSISVNDELFRKDGEFSYVDYLVNIIGAMRILRLSMNLAFGNMSLMHFLAGFADRSLRYMLTENLGDVTVYTSMDESCAYHNIRKSILKGAYSMLKCLLLDNEYDEIVLYGHSLGSVIAYDALGMLNREMNIDPGLRDFAGKITELITFGSPLDKTAFFFDEKLDNDRNRVRYNIVTQLHGLRRKNIDESILHNGIEQYFNHVKWTNYWSKSDPISGHLDVYTDVRNIEMDFSHLSNPHSEYWKYL